MGSFAVEPDGRIALRSSQISSGYLGEPDRADAWFVTNDIGELGDDGAVRVTILLTTRGARSGKPRSAELYAWPDADRLVIVGSSGGSAESIGSPW